MDSFEAEALELRSFATIGSYDAWGRPVVSSGILRDECGNGIGHTEVTSESVDVTCERLAAARMELQS